MADLYFCYATLFCGYVCLLLKMKSYLGGTIKYFV